MVHYRAVLFDADGTLLDYDRAENYALLKIFDILKLQCDPNSAINLYRRINSDLWREFERGSISTDNLKVERFRVFLSRSGINASASKLSSTYLELLGEAGFLIPGAQKVLSKLQDTVHLSLVTNGFSKVQRSRLKRSGTEGYFSHIFISEEVGCQKPEPEIFDYTMKLLSPINRNEVLFVGDSLTSDIRGGNHAGVDTCWYNPKKKERGTEIIPRFEISRLEDVVELAQQTR